MLRELATQTFDAVHRVIDEHRVEPELFEVGTVVQVAEAVAIVRGFTSLGTDELLRFASGALGIAANIARHEVGVILLGSSEELRTGEEVRRTHRVIDTPVGDGLLGRVVDAVGRPLDGKGPLKASRRWPVERPAPAIMDRAPVTVPLATGIKAIDATIPIGRGQRELIIGDRQTGKTTIAVDTILNQRDVLSVYCTIGQRGTAVARVLAELEARHALERSVIVVASGEDPPGLQFVAPYAAMSIAECFMVEGRDVLVVFDDLTRHARTYRELSLLLRRPPGREAYPGDIFYIHSRLLERATHLREEHGGGSITALPIIETQAQNIAAYIPTNLISITDGQIYLSPTLFQRGQLPAIDIGKSVSRVGGKAQLPAYRSVAGALRLFYAQFEELEAFSRLGTRLDEATRQSLARGRRVREVLKQPQGSPLGAAEQIGVLLATTEGLFDRLSPEGLEQAEAAVRRALRAELGELCARLELGDELGKDDRDAILDAARRALTAGDDRASGPPRSAQ